MTRGLPLTLMLMLLALITYSQLNTPNSWQWQYPKPFKGAFLAVEKVSDGIIAGGEKSILQKTTDGGDTWVQIEVPEELSIRYMEFFNGGTTGYYFGEKGKPYKSTNSGNTWSIDNTFPTNDSIISANMYHDTLAVYYGSGANTYSAKLVAGGTWQTSVTAARVVAGHYPYYTSHNYTTIDTIYAFDTIRGTQSVPGGRYVCKIIPSYDELAVYLAVKEVVNGIVYSRLQYGIAAGQTQGSLSDGLGSYSHVFYQDANTWYASEVLESGISDFFDIGNFSKTTNGGQNWTSLGYVGVYDVEFDNAFENYAATTRAQVIKTINAGALYTNTQVGDYIKFTIDLTEYLVDIASIYQIGNVVYGYGLGRGVVSMTGVYKYMFVKSTDFGRTWTLLHAYDPQLTGFSPELYVTRKFIAFNDNEFWALKARRQDSYGSMSSSYSFLDIGSYNSGTTTVTSMQMSAEDLIDFHCFSSTNAVFLSNNSSTFANDLSRFIWDPVNLSPTITPISNSMGTFGLFTVSFANQQVGFATGTMGKIVRTLDGGTTWADASVAGVDINNIQCISADTVFVVANSGGFFRSYNASDININWVPKGTQTFDSLYYLKFYDGQNGFVVTNSDLLLTHNGGNTFQKLEIPFDYEGSYDTAHINPWSFGDDMVYKIGKRTGNVVATDKSLTSFVYANRGVVLTYGSGNVNTGIADVIDDADGISLHPVPTGDYLYVSMLEEEVAPPNISIFDIQGKSIVLPMVSHNSAIDVSSLLPGVYILKVSSEKGIATKKFVKQ